jgi:hypothetical protein
MKTWLFFDHWHIEAQDNVALCQGQPKWCPEAAYEDPSFDHLEMWPTVYRDQSSGRWHLLYYASSFPLVLMGAESEDGIHWQPISRTEIQPPGEKYAPHHLFTVPAAGGGAVYIDPTSSDARPFKFFFSQKGGPKAAQAGLDAEAYVDETIQKEMGIKPYLSEHRMAASADGLDWEVDPTASWGWVKHPSWQPEDPIFCFFNDKLKLHTMITRPGWGDRRVVLLTSPDTIRWSKPELLLQPDSLDPPQFHFYGMPVVAYEGLFVGFLWTAHFANCTRLDRFNQMWGIIDNQLTYSYDGLRFQRGLRRPFIPLNDPGQPGSAIIYPTCLVEHNDELRIYSVGSRHWHGWHIGENMETKLRRPLPKGEGPSTAILTHTLRKDGFMYLASKGGWARFISKPMVLKEPKLSINAQAPYGELRCQMCDMESRPLEGFSFEENVPFIENDALDWALAWKGGSLTELVGKVVRLEFKFRHARLYAVRGDFHFADAVDVTMIADGQPIDTKPFDF